MIEGNVWTKISTVFGTLLSASIYMLGFLWIVVGIIKACEVLAGLK